MAATYVPSTEGKQGQNTFQNTQEHRTNRTKKRENGVENDTLDKQI